MDPTISANVGTLAPAKKLRISSSSDSLGEDLFQMNPKLIFKSTASTAIISKPHEEEFIRDASSDSSTKSGRSGYTDTASAVSCVTHESTLQSMSPKQSPPIQVMERAGGYDPSRIPSSVFACQSPTLTEWSITSNESLFSLHIGNNSLTRDHLLEMCGDLPKSGELDKSGELLKSSELISLRLSPRAAVGRERDSTVDAENLAIGVGDEILKNGPRGTANDHREEKLPSLEMSCNSSNTNRPLDMNSGKCFANPKIAHAQGHKYG
ncbi:uncharacterized protein LOC132296131 [Cornus florida]|uniref:uncharacterized protein LOC132296131 n=1 Tax=Cornus florida TaxID=4283 RepID=UPI0028987C27|nr:uncharacterized protein LOC132296131 [Cornus florida]